MLFYKHWISKWAFQFAFLYLFMFLLIWIKQHFWNVLDRCIYVDVSTIKWKSSRKRVSHWSTWLTSLCSKCVLMNKNVYFIPPITIWIICVLFYFLRNILWRMKTLFISEVYWCLSSDSIFANSTEPFKGFNIPIWILLWLFQNFENYMVLPLSKIEIR